MTGSARNRVLVLLTSAIGQINQRQRCLTPNQPSRGTRSWTPTVINRRRSSVDVESTWPRRCCCHVMPTTGRRMSLVYIALGDAGRAVSKFSKSRVWGQRSRGKQPYFWNILLSSKHNVARFEPREKLVWKKSSRSVQPFRYNFGVCRVTDTHTHTHTHTDTRRQHMPR